MLGFGDQVLREPRRCRDRNGGNYYWQSVYELLEELGYHVSLAHPMRTRIIASARIKTMFVIQGLDAPAGTQLVARCLLPPKEIRDPRELARLHAS